MSDESKVAFLNSWFDAPDGYHWSHGMSNAVEEEVSDRFDEALTAMNVALPTNTLDREAIKAAGIREGLEAAALYHNEEAATYEGNSGAKDGVAFPLVAEMHRKFAQHICSLSTTDILQVSSRVSLLEAALEAILFEDSDKTEEQRLFDRVQARATLEAKSQLPKTGGE